MLIFLLLVWPACLVSAASNIPTFSLLSEGGGQFSVITDSPEVIDVSVVYRVDGGDEHMVMLSHTGDGFWRRTIPSLNPKRNLTYFSTFYYFSGSSASEIQIWKPVAMMALPPNKMRGAVIFRDDFNGDTLDLNQWLIAVTATGDYHNEFQVYTNDRKNVYVKGGHVYMKPTLTVDSGHFTENDLYHGVMDVKKTWGACTESGAHGCYRDSKDGLLPPTMSGRIESKPTMKYGTVTVRAQIPRGDWLWPAIWMMPRHSRYGGWPRSGEIDIMEATCNEIMHWGGGKNVGIQRFVSTLHQGPHGHDKTVFGFKTKSTGDWHAFHTYELKWTPDHLIISVDGDMVTRMDIPDGSSVWQHLGFQGNNIWSHGSKIAPFDQQFYLILNVAVGGTGGMFGEGATYAYPKPWKNNAKDPLADFWAGRHLWLPAWHGDDVAMIIDYVEFRHL